LRLTEGGIKLWTCIKMTRNFHAKKNITNRLQEARKLADNTDVKEKIAFSRELESIVFNSLRFVNLDSEHIHGEIKSACFLLFLKSFLLFSNAIDLLKNNQISAAPYLIRGIIEARADINFIQKKRDKKLASRFFKTANVIRNEQIGLDFSKDFPSDVYWTEERIKTRVKLLGDPVSWAYNYLSMFVHNTCINGDIWSRKEQVLAINEQLFFANHNFLEIIDLVNFKDMKINSIEKKFRKIFGLTAR